MVWDAPGMPSFPTCMLWNEVPNDMSNCSARHSSDSLVTIATDFFFPSDFSALISLLPFWPCIWLRLAEMEATRQPGSPLCWNSGKITVIHLFKNYFGARS